MKAPKEIAQKAERYEECKKEADKLFEELKEWFMKNHDDDGYYDGFGVSQEPAGEEQDEGEYCDQYQHGEDSYSGTYYLSVEESTKYVWYSYWM